MSAQRGWSAGGKLFVSGEFAVLWGGVARLVAVGPRVQALARRRDDGRVALLLPGTRLEGAATPQGVRWTEPPGEAFRFVARAVDLGLRATQAPGTGFSVAFAPSLTAAGQKLGLGSSARAAVLATQAARWALDADFDPLKLALVAHAGAQGGRGSGGDVAAIAAGGAVAYRRFDPAAALAASTSGGLEAALSRSPPVEVVRESPPALGLVYVFTGQSASSPALIGQAERVLEPARRPEFVRRSDTLSAALQEALVRGDARVAREAAEALQALLATLASAPSPALERVLHLARACGCAVKQSGAGGGDGCLAFAPDPVASRALVEAASARGFQAREVSLTEGVLVESESEPTLVSWL